MSDNPSTVRPIGLETSSRSVTIELLQTGSTIPITLTISNVVYARPALEQRLATIRQLTRSIDTQRQTPSATTGRRDPLINHTEQNPSIIPQVPSVHQRQALPATSAGSSSQPTSVQPSYSELLQRAIQTELADLSGQVGFVHVRSPTYASMPDLESDHEDLNSARWGLPTVDSGANRHGTSDCKGNAPSPAAATDAAPDADADYLDILNSSRRMRGYWRTRNGGRHSTQVGSRGIPFRLARPMMDIPLPCTGQPCPVCLLTQSRLGYPSRARMAVMWRSARFPTCGCH